jgi:phage terminase large subunit GpA-like protein
LEFGRMVWQRGRPETVAYRCAGCAAPIGEAHKPTMLAAGEWRATAPAGDPAVVGYHLSALYAPLGWLSWAEIARMAEDASRDPTLQKNLDNTVLGIAFAERGDAPDWHRLRDRQTRAARGRVPAGVRFLTCGVDVQSDRLEASVWGWGRGRRSWLVDHVVIEGDVAGEAPWAALTELAARTYPAGGGALAVPIARIAVDTGYLPTSVHAWARTLPAGRVVLVRGGGPSVALVSLPRTAEAVDTSRTTKRRRPRRVLRVWSVDTHAIKLETYAWLNLAAPDDGASFPAGWVSLPAVGDEFLRQLTAENLVRKIVGGVERHVWIKTYNRNEALDCRVYARAAAHLVGLDRFTEADWTALDEPFAALPPRDEETDPPPPASPAAAAAVPPVPPPPPVAPVVPVPGAAAPAPQWRSSSYWDRQRR